MNIYNFFNFLQVAVKKPQACHTFDEVLVWRTGKCNPRVVRSGGLSISPGVRCSYARLSVWGWPPQLPPTAAQQHTWWPSPEAHLLWWPAAGFENRNIGMVQGFVCKKDWNWYVVILMKFSSLAAQCSQKFLQNDDILISPRSTKLKGVYWFHLVCSSVCLSVRSSVDRIMSALHLLQYSLDPFNIYTSYKATSEGLLSVKVCCFFFQN